MKLLDLNPRWMGAGGEGVSQLDPATGEYVPAPERTGVGVLFDCPCGNCAEDHQCYVPFHNPLDGGPSLSAGNPGWQRTGDAFETLTLTPSIQRRVVNGHGCTWHGFITNGEIVSC